MPRAGTIGWVRFPYPDPAFTYTPASLKKAWHRLHAGDAEPYPHDARLLDAWIAFHAGDFERATRLGLELGLDGYAVANKAGCIHAVYLEKTGPRRRSRLLEVAERCEQQQEQQPGNAAAFYWHAYALGRYAQDISIVAALAQGVATRVRASLERTLELAPHHADAHTALGVYHAEIIDKVGALVAKLTYGANEAACLRHFRKALELNPHSAIARVEFANALIMLDADGKTAEAAALVQAAAAMEPHDAMEKLDIERAKRELGS